MNDAAETHQAAADSDSAVDADSRQPTPVAVHLPGARSDSIGRQVFLLALPMLGEQYLNFLVALFDTWIAKFLGMEATNAVGTGAYMGWFVGLIGSLVGTGSAALVSRSFGARDIRTADRAANQSLILALAFGAAMTVTVYSIAPPLAALFTQTPEAEAMVLKFLRIDCFGYTLFSVALVCGGAMRAAGDTRTPLVIQAGVNVVNIALVYSAVFILDLGIEGIAASTAIARSLGGLIVFLVLTRGLRGMRITRAGLRPDPEIIRRILRVGVPAGIDAGMMWLAQMAFLAIVAHSASGDAATVNSAAHMIAMRVEAISFLPAVAWMTAAATLVGQYLGAGDARRAMRAGHLAALQAASLCTVIGAVFFLASNQIYAQMSQDPEVQRVGGATFKYLGIVQPILAMAIVYIGALRGAGDTRTTMVFALVGGLGVRVPVAYLGAIILQWGLFGAWLGMWADNVVKFALGLMRFAGGRWKHTRV